MVVLSAELPAARTVQSGAPVSSAVRLFVEWAPLPGLPTEPRVAMERLMKWVLPSHLVKVQGAKGCLVVVPLLSAAHTVVVRVPPVAFEVRA